MVTELLKVLDLYKYFPLTRGLIRKTTVFVRAVDGISFDINMGETFVLIGESGSGKSTVAKIVLKLLDPDRGKIIFDSRDVTFLKAKHLKWYRANVQGLFQNPHTSLNPVMKVLDLVIEPAVELKGMEREDAEKEAVELLTSLGLSRELFKKYPSELSGGQAQRVALARALIVKPRLLVLDEPTSALDVSTQLQILNLLESVKREYRLSYLLITHDMGVARYLGDRVAVIYLGKIVEQGTVDAIFESPLHPYTQTLLASVLEPGKSPTKAVIESKEYVEASAVNMPRGCRFHPRCPYASEICRREEPPLTAIDKDHFVACWLQQRR